MCMQATQQMHLGLLSRIQTSPATKDHNGQLEKEPKTTNKSGKENLPSPINELKNAVGPKRTSGVAKQTLQTPVHRSGRAAILR